MSNADVIAQIRDQAPSDAEALAQMFESTAISGGTNAVDRLRAVLRATEHIAVPGLQTGIRFHDSGFRPEFRDIWPSSDNQVGHFLTAVGLSFNPAKVAQSCMGRRLRDWLGAPDAMSDEEVALRLCIGHEKSPDPSAATAAGGAAGGAVIPVPGTAIPGAIVGAGIAILRAFRAQFAAATDQDVQVFRGAEGVLGAGPQLNLTAANSALQGISVNPSNRGNSYQDLLLTLYGWRLGQLIRHGQLTTGVAVAAWIRANLKA